METAKNITEDIRLLQRGIQHPYRENLFKELEKWKELTNSDKMNFYWANLDTQKLYAMENAHEYKLCDFIIDYPGTICGVAAYFKKIYVIDDITKMGQEWSHDVKVEHIKASSVICVPILDSKNNVLGVMELYKEDNPTKYSEFMIECIKDVAGWMGIVFEQAIKSTNHKYFETIFKSCSINLAYYCKGTMSFIDYLQSLISIMKNVLGAEKILLYEMDTENSLLVYYGMPISFRRVKQSNNLRYVNSAAESKKMLKVKFDKGDKKITNEFLLGFKIKINNLMVLPVLSGDTVLAVLQCVNYQYEDDYSTKVLDYVFTFCRIGVQLKRLKDTLELDKAHNTIIISRLKYQMTRHLDKRMEFEFNLEDEDIGEFDYYPKKFDIIVPAVSYMFKSLCKDLIIERTLNEFLILVEKCHKHNLPFHNIFQSCDSANTMYSIIIRNSEFFKDYEILTLLICSYLNAIDYNGLSNFVMEHIKHPLSMIYFTNYKEKNRQNIGIFLIERTGLLSHLPQKKQEKIMKLFKNIMQLEKNYNTAAYRARIEKSLIGKDPQNWSDPLRTHWLEFLVWCSYHSRHAKPFKVSKTLTDGVYEEYYQNGDILQQFGIKPKTNQSREYANNIFEHELTYLRSTLLPGYKFLKEIFPSTHELYDAAEQTMENYRNACDLKGKSSWHPGISIGLAK